MSGLVARWRRWRYRRKLSAWQARLPEGVFVSDVGDWALEPIGSVIDISSWSMPPHRSWPVDPHWVPRRRVAPEPAGPRAVRIVGKSPAGDLVAYEVVAGL